MPAPSLAYLLSTDIHIRYLEHDSRTYTRSITTAQGLRGHHVAIPTTIAYVVLRSTTSALGHLRSCLIGVGFLPKRSRQ